MPIYAYRCSACGHAKDVLQKVSDPQLSVCPACGADAFRKQVTAAGFQLKGSGWYVTDFKGNGAKPPEKTEKADKPAEPGAAPAGGASPPAASAKAPESGAASTAAPAAPAGSGGSSGGDS